MSSFVRWNTGRQYDEHGQRMVAVVVNDGKKLLFHDLSRGIRGAIPLGDFALGRDLDKHAIEQLVMTNYNYGNYSGSDWKILDEQTESEVSNEH